MSSGYRTPQLPHPFQHPPELADEKTPTRLTALPVKAHEFTLPKSFKDAIHYSCLPAILP